MQKVYRGVYSILEYLVRNDVKLYKIKKDFLVSQSPSPKRLVKEVSIVDKKSFKDAKIDHVYGMIINGVRVTVVVYQDGHSVVSIKK